MTDRPSALPGSPPERPPEPETIPPSAEPSHLQHADNENLPDATPAFRSGSTLADLPARFGRYRLEQVLGKGGMGSVFLAYDTKLHRHVALKVPKFGRDEGELRERFFREARAAATLRHPNLCPVFDIGEQDEVHFLTMAYIQGEPLSEYLRANNPLPQTEVAALVRVLAKALEEAHEHGIIHRDLKPTNVIISRKREPIVTDFGLARRSASQDERLTHSGAFLGTPAYMPPEQVNGDVAAMGPGCDIYSLGVILYELLAGRRPFEGPIGMLIAQVVMDAPPPPTRFRPELDPALEAICLKALAKKPEDRHPSMGEFAQALEAWLASNPSPAANVDSVRTLAPSDSRPPLLPEPPHLAAGVETLTTTATQRPGSQAPQGKKRRGLWLLVFFAVFFVTCLLPLGWIAYMVHQVVNKVSDGLTGIGGRFEDQQKEQIRLLEERKKEQKDLEELARTWKPPPASANPDRVFPKTVGAFSLAESDDKADIAELNVAATGRRALYRGPAGAVELFAYRANKLEKKAILRDALEAVTRQTGMPFLGLGAPSVLGSPEGTYLSYELGPAGAESRSYGVFWWQHDWLFLARGRAPQDPGPFLKEYLSEVMKD